MAVIRSIAQAISRVTSSSGTVAQGKTISVPFSRHKSTSSPQTPVVRFVEVKPSHQPRGSISSKLFSTQTTKLPYISNSASGKLIRKNRMEVATLNISSTNYSTVASKMQPDIHSVDENVDPVQRQLLEEQCIVLDDNDKVIGHDTKRNCHRVINGDVLLHRAFSVFLFNGNGELLLQQRSKTKITFPLMWTNTCCSHPLYEESELTEKDTLGVKRAARRRLEIELGIPPDSINLDDFQYLTRIHYKALSDSIWGEHEIDYILFLQKDGLLINPNPDEIQDIRWVTLSNVNEMIGKENVSLTPWFELILKSKLPIWWKSLENLHPFQDHDTIHRM